MKHSTAAATVTAAALLLSACSGGPPSTPSGLPLTGASANAILANRGARPNGAFASYVKVIFRNETSQTLHMHTSYSYPIFGPGWLMYEVRCVKPHTEWKSEIGFNYPDPQVRVGTQFNGECQPHSRILSGYVSFKSITFSNGEPERATIESDMKESNGVFKLCGRQTQPVQKQQECAVIPRL
ncbi:MAG TPA: hypothetical protein VJP76_04170 [Candidatus Tumulicola sp.]|nr:hypothetical protein [Candidatus Tumulicola sp.]